jgi:site-specific recombinase XerD
MGRITQHNNITNDALLAKVNPDNQSLKRDFLAYLHSIGRSEGTILSYANDLDIFFIWNLQNNGDKHFTAVSKRDFIAFQNWLISTNGNSPARVRRLRATISSLSNYIENILDRMVPLHGNVYRIIP